ncbi:MinD/ParA family ATP-binding protein [Microbacterium hydrocarbonoxydans]|uniref:MinD/ParA family ATP-binding protein n=1 Tax=Microbacterium hydrocarbonoxydans TaxID=273678 RepID=UPI00203CB477|nr:MinD/ParA family protein [Microbacterium hydrocarbonoxydans]MCM3781061.1 MinD/ParA family protein [Microbacterium hydrocarbonoxydans]
MTPKNVAEPPDDESRGVLDDAASLDTTGIGILGHTAQVSVQLPKDEDDALEDDGVVEGEVVADLIVDEPVPAAKAAAEISEVSLSTPMIIELPAEQVDAKPAAPTAEEDVSNAEAEADATDEELAVVGADRVVVDQDSSIEPEDDVEGDGPDDETIEPDVVDESDEIAEHDMVVESDGAGELGEAADVEDGSESPEPDAVVGREVAETASEDGAASDRADDVRLPEQTQPAESEDAAPALTATGSELTTELDHDAEAAAAAVFVARARADLDTRSRTRASDAVRPKEDAVVEQPEKPVPTRHAARASRSDVQLTAKRLDDLSDTSRESADLLTADRLLDPHRVTKPEPEGAWSHFLYTISGRRINIGDGRRARERKALTSRIAAPLTGGARFVPVLSRKGGVGKTILTTLLGMALADARDDRVIAVDANPDRGTLADRVVRPQHNRSVRDLVRIHDDIKGYHDISGVVSRDVTRLDVLASDSDPRIAEAFSDSDYRDVAEVAAHYYSLVLTDTGTGIVHSVMAATLDLADQFVIVSGLSVDEARLASETLTWLETNGYAEQARDAVVVLNQSHPGAPLVRLDELENHFRTRAKHVVRMPYDAQIAGGGPIVFANLQPETRKAAREIAALLVEGLRAKAA